MATAEEKLKKAQEALKEAKRLNLELKTSSQTIPDPSLQMKLIENRKEISKLELQIETLKHPAKSKKK